LRVVISHAQVFTVSSDERLYEHFALMPYSHFMLIVIIMWFANIWNWWL